MIKSRVKQLISRIFILAIMVVGVILSTNIEGTSPNFYLYYTNLSNYLCLLIVFLEIVITISKLQRNITHGNDDVHPGIKLAVLIDIAVTFFVFNILLVDKSNNILTPVYWKNTSSVLLHFVCPILFFLDWLLFAEHGQTRWYHPFLVLIFPLIYVAAILIRGEFVSPNASLIYPYFFLNVTEIGYSKVFMWVGILVAVFLVLSYLVYLFDNVKRFKNRKK